MTSIKEQIDAKFDKRLPAIAQLGPRDLFREGWFAALKDQNPSYITTTHGGSGYFAVLMTYYPEDGFYDVQQTGVGRFVWKDQAIAEAKEWAKAEGLEYRP